MAHLDILLPFALPPAAMAADLLKELDLPALSVLISRTAFERGHARRQSHDEFQRSLPHEAWLADRFALKHEPQNSPPVAADLMRELGIAVENGLWFVLQPVHIHIARDHLVLTDPRQLMLTQAQASVLFDIAKPLFDEAGMDLRYGNADTWFLRADDWAGLQTATPDAASGHNIDIWMPKGPTERQWRKIQNEVQMHWHGHAVNEERETSGQKPVNSLWLWGAENAADTPVPSSYSAAFNLSGWTRALHRHLLRHANASAADVLAAAPEQGLVMLDNLLEPALANDWPHWLEQMRALETAWFAPLLDALRRGSIDRLTLIANNDSKLAHFSSSRATLRKFWVKPSLLALNT